MQSCIDNSFLIGFNMRYRRYLSPRHTTLLSFTIRTSSGVPSSKITVGLYCTMSICVLPNVPAEEKPFTHRDVAGSSCLFLFLEISVEHTPKRSPSDLYDVANFNFMI